MLVSHLQILPYKPTIFTRFSFYETYSITTKLFVIKIFYLTNSSKRKIEKRLKLIVDINLHVPKVKTMHILKVLTLAPFSFVSVLSMDADKTDKSGDINVRNEETSDTNNVGKSKAKSKKQGVRSSDTGARTLTTESKRSTSPDATHLMYQIFHQKN